MSKLFLRATSLLLLFFTFKAQVFSQQIATPKLGNWQMLFSQMRIKEKWSIHTEAQFRDYKIFLEPEQILLRVGINYHHSPNVLFTGGYARVFNFPFDNEIMQNSSFSENRLWQQIILRNNVERMTFEHRYRLEQRFLKSKNSTTYLNRIRYLVRLTIPLNSEKVEKKTLFLSFYDELFIHLSPTPFDRNRLYGAMGYQLLENSNLQAGYLAQTIGTVTKSYFQLALFYNFDLRKRE